jgi:hypothetical protein
LSSEEAANAVRKVKKVVDEHNQSMDKAPPKLMGMGEAFSKAASAAMAFG